MSRSQDCVSKVMLRADIGFLLVTGYGLDIFSRVETLNPKPICIGIREIEQSCCLSGFRVKGTVEGLMKIVLRTFRGFCRNFCGWRKPCATLYPV